MTGSTTVFNVIEIEFIVRTKKLPSLNYTDIMSSLNENVIHVVFNSFLQIERYLSRIFCVPTSGKN